MFSSIFNLNEVNSDNTSKFLSSARVTHTFIVCFLHQVFSSMPELRVLTLSHNPCVSKIKNYRKMFINLCVSNSLLCPTKRYNGASILSVGQYYVPPVIIMGQVSCVHVWQGYVPPVITFPTLLKYSPHQQLLSNISDSWNPSFPSSFHVIIDYSCSLISIYILYFPQVNLRHLDDYPVFDKDRKCATAW